MKYHLELLNILYNEGFDKLLDKLGDILNKEESILNLIMMNMNDNNNIVLLCKFIKRDISRYEGLIKKILLSDIKYKYKKIFISNLLNSYDKRVLDIFGKMEYELIFEENIDIEDSIIYKWSDYNDFIENREYYEYFYEKFREYNEDIYIVWIYDVINKYDYRCKSYNVEDILRDDLLYIVLEIILEDDMEMNICEYIEYSSDLCEIKYENVKVGDRNMMMLLKLLNVCIYYSMDELKKIDENISNCKSIINKLEYNNGVLLQFEIIKNYLKKQNDTLLLKYEKEKESIYNKLNRKIIDKIYRYYVNIMNELVKYGINDRENSILYSNIVINIIDFYIYCGRETKYIYNNLNEKNEISRYFCDIFNSNISNVNINIKLIDLYSEIMLNEMMYILNNIDKNKVINDYILCLIKNLKSFYIEIDNYDDYYKHDIKYKIIYLFNNIFNKPKLIRNYLEEIIINDNENMLKFMVNMNETNNVCIEKYIVYANDISYTYVSNTYYLYIQEINIYNNFVINLYKDRIEDDIINIMINKMNNNMMDLVKKTKDLDRLYNIMIYLMECYLILKDEKYLTMIGGDILFKIDIIKMKCVELRNMEEKKREVIIINEFIEYLEDIEKLDIEDEIEYENIPEDYIDPISNIIMRNPVLLPTSKKIMDYDVIRKHLLYHNFDPFNRNKLSLKDIEDYNNIEKNKESMTHFKMEINKWKDEQNK